MPEKVAGIDFAAALCERIKDTGHRLFLLGAKPGIAEKAARNLQERYPGLQICGTRDGYFKDDREAVEKVNAAKPDVVFVCLGAPKQEFFVDRNWDSLQATLFVGLGGSLDVFAGEVKRAPKIFIKLGLEWFYRLLCQPSRLGRMMRLPKFMMAARRDAKKGDKRL